VGIEKPRPNTFTSALNCRSATSAVQAVLRTGISTTSNGRLAAVDIFDAFQDIIYLSACLTYLYQSLVSNVPKPGQAWFDIHDEHVYVVVCVLRVPARTVMAYNFDTKSRRAFNYRHFTRSRRFQRIH
jgi:hypothetical protein